MAERPAIEPITVTVKQFKELSHLGNTSIYALIKSGQIQSVTIGRRRLIILASWHALLARRGGRKAKLVLVDGADDSSVAKMSFNPLER